MLSEVYALSNGYVAFPVIEACQRRGLFELLSQTRSLKASIARKKLKAHHRYFNTALQAMEKLDWIVRTEHHALLLKENFTFDQTCKEIIGVYTVPPDELLAAPAGQDLVARLIGILLQHENVWPPNLFQAAQGAVILPLLIALKKNGPHFNRPLFSDLPPVLNALLEDWFSHKKWGKRHKHKFHLTANGRVLLECAGILDGVAAWRPMLRNMYRLLFEQRKKANRPDNRKSQTPGLCMHDACAHVANLFSQQPVEKQPAFIAVWGCGDGTFLQDIYTSIQTQSERGKVLDKYPLTLIGIDSHTASLQKAAKRLKGTPLVTFKGDPSLPGQVMQELSARGIADPDQILHISAFIHPSVARKKKTDSGPNRCAKALMTEGAAAGAEGGAGCAGGILNACQHHLEGWAGVLSGYGLVMMASHCEPRPEPPGPMKGTEDFSSEILHAFSALSFIEAETFVIKAANSGLFAKSMPGRYPAGSGVCRHTLSHLEKRDYIIRHAQKTDVKRLAELNALCGGSDQAFPKRLKQRLERYPRGQFVLERKGVFLGAVYSQRIDSPGVLRGRQIEDTHHLHSAQGAVVHLLDIHLHPGLAEQRLPEQLLEFILHRCCLMQGVKSVVRMIPCEAGNDICEGDENGFSPEAAIRLHESKGARVEPVISGGPRQNEQKERLAVLVLHDLANRQNAREVQPMPMVARKAPEARPEDIAIVGMACRFPGARNYNEFWENLIQGKNSIAQIPPERWRWEDYYGDPEKDRNKTRIKWGGFIEDIDKFDPLFFNISPNEAKYIDPQHRLFLESAWHAIEDAGYDPGRLSGRQIGVYAGVSKNDYAELMREKQEAIISFVSTGTVHSILTNRVSFLLNFLGKSEAVDTACSSFLAALHNAVRDIQLGLCEAAVVGGVNALLTPTMYISHSKSGMLSEDGTCKTFDAGANGYVRGEGVGVIFIKALKQASADRDNIIGVIKGMAVQHGGRSNFLTSPKASSQASVVSAALRNAGVDPGSIGYIEVHGTGTPLGDPIEVNGLKQVFGPYAKPGDKPFCGLSSVKTNIGHLESAAGVAGLIKILLSFRHRRIPALLHFKELNPYIKLDDSPFFIVSPHHDWQHRLRNGRRVPLRAGLSSFGMGGVNAHLILEEPPHQTRSPHDRGTCLVPLSAKTTDRLNAYVVSLRSFLESGAAIPAMNDLAYTLQTGRAAMAQRVLFLAKDLRHLMDLLQHFIEGRENEHLFTGKADQAPESDAPALIITDDNLQMIAHRWVQGHPVDWQSLYQSRSGHKVALPVYPFQKMRCWFSAAPEQRLKTWTHQFKPSDYDIRDHVVQGDPMLPGVKYLELFRAAGEQRCKAPVRVLRDIFWLKPVKVPHRVHATIETRENGNKNLVSLSFKQGNTVFATGEVVPGGAPVSKRNVNLEKIKQRCGEIQDRQTLYKRLKQHGLNYGQTFQVIQNCRYNQEEILCELDQSQQVPSSGYFLEPSIMDGVFQSAAALHLLTNKNDAVQFLPFYLKAIEIHRAIPSRCYAYARRCEDSTADDRVAYNMVLCDGDGRIVVRFEKFVKRAYEALPASQETGPPEVSLLWYTSQWVRRRVSMHCENPSVVLLFDDEEELASSLHQTTLCSHLLRIKTGPAFAVEDDATCAVNPSDPASLEALWRHLARQNLKTDCIVYKWNFTPLSSVRDRLVMGAQFLMTLTQSLLAAKVNHRIRIFYLHPLTRSLDESLHAMVGGLSRTLAYENPHLRIFSLGMDNTAPEQTARWIGQELGFYANAPLYEIRYVMNQRSVRAIVPFAPPDGEVERPLLRQRGTYLITGGCGGLGQIFARYLARRFEARLILVGRSAVNAAIEEKLSALRELGGSASYRPADIADASALGELFEGLRRQKIDLNGIFHCAGLIDDAFILHKTLSSWQRVIQPKVFGAVHLDRLTRRIPLDFFIVFSSIASLMPNQGQCDYAAANSFLDSFAAHRNRLRHEGRRSGVTIAVNWPLWRNGGIGVGRKEEDHLWQVFGMKPLGDATGLSVLEHILNARSDFAQDQVISIEGVPSKIEKHLKVLAPEEDLFQRKIDSEAELKAHLIEMIARIHPKKQMIKEHENICAFGVDSIGLTHLTARINEALNLDIEPTLFFENATVADIAALLWQAGLPQAVAGQKAAGGDAADYIPERALLDLEDCTPARLHFQKKLSDTEFFMRDHVVDGQYNVPGACFIEMALQAGEMTGKDTCVARLSNNYWAKQLSTTGAVIQADIDFIARDGYYDYEISSSEGGRRQIHALGQVHARSKSDLHGVVPEPLDLSSIKDRCTTTRPFDEIYQLIQAEGLHLGPGFKPMLSIDLNEEEALAHLKLPRFLSETVSDYVLHPSLLTGVLQAALLNNKPGGMDDTRFIPMAMDEVWVGKKLPSECYVYTRDLNRDKAHASVRKFDAWIATPDGDVVATIKGIGLRNLTASKKPASDAARARTRPPAGQGRVDLQQVEDFLKALLSGPVGLPAAQIESDVFFESYGINSVMIIDLNNRLADIFGNLSKTLFFEYRNVQELAQYFAANHAAALQQELAAGASTREGPQEASLSDENLGGKERDTAGGDDDIFSAMAEDRAGLAPAKPGLDEDIAVIGVGGRYPMARTLDQFWDNLKQGRDCISEIPASRFDYTAFWDPDRPKPALSSKWGGFIDDIDLFDPLFFNISPREAALIDPQERLFLQVVWETLEDAGYSRSALKDQAVGVFTGALWQPYIALGVEQTCRGNLQNPSGLLYSIPNRISFFFDWCGPSMAIDTACSGSLTALHLACESLKRGECRSAIAGGVNLSLGSSKYLWLSQNNFLSSDGRCRSFGAGGDGYVPGEGVGAVYLKRLPDALKDGDRIDGVIKATAVNHGGRTSGYTIPNPNRQGDLILTALNKCGVTPDRITYVEAHGTGTSLGDPIEIRGLQKAFSRFADAKAFCAIGSVKSNIGHLEAAAGIAGLTKILLQMKHATLVPCLHTEPPNPNIDFAASPFRVQKELAPWAVREGARCAMLSSFGAGGSYAHAIVEEFRPEQYRESSHPPIVLSPGQKLIVPLSARTAEQLSALVDQLLAFLKNKAAAVNLVDVAYTLQTGREPLEERLVFLVERPDELLQKLEDYLRGEADAQAGVYRGNVKTDKVFFRFLFADRDIHQVLTKWVARGDGEKIANLWAKGAAVDWEQLYAGMRPRRVSLPKYPFARERYWLPEEKPSEAAGSIERQRLDGAPALAVRAPAFEKRARAKPAGPVNPIGDNTPPSLPRIRLKPPADAHCRTGFPDPAEKPRGLVLTHRQDTWTAVRWSGEDKPCDTGERIPPPSAGGEATDDRRTDSAAARETVPSLEALREALTLSLAKALYLQPGEIDPEISFVDMGLDSIVGVEWIQTLNTRFGLSVAATRVYDYPNIRALAGFLKDEMACSDPMASGAPPLASPHIQDRIEPETDPALPDRPAPARDVLHGELAASLAQALFIDPGDVDLDTPFIDLGLDSIVGVEWIQAINRKYGLAVEATRVYDYPDIRSMARFLEEQIRSPAALGNPDVLAPGDRAAGPQISQAADMGRPDPPVINPPDLIPPEIVFMPRNCAPYDRLYFHGNQYTGDFARNGEISIHYVLNPSQNICLENHRVFGRPVFPTDAFIELIYAACHTYFNMNALVMTHVTIANPLAGRTGESLVVSLLFRKHGRGLGFTAESRPAGRSGGAKVHLRGFVQPAEGTGAWPIRFSDLSAEDVENRFDVDTYYDSRANIVLGDFYRGLKALNFGSRQAVGVIQAQEGQERFLLHPSMINAALACVLSYGPYQLGKQHDPAGDCFLPHHIHGLMITGPITTNACLCYTEVEKIEKDRVELYFEMVDADHRPLLICQSIGLQRVGAAKIQPVAAARPAPAVSRSASNPEPVSPSRQTPPQPAMIEVAVIGMSCRFPQSKDCDAFWEVLKNGTDCITEVPAERWAAYQNWYHPDPANPHTSYSKWGGFIEDIDKFDPLFFNIAPTEAELMDPQQRIFLEETWKAIESAGYNPRDLGSQSCGVYVGCTTGDYVQALARSGQHTHGAAFTGTSSAILVSRISYLLNLRGPSLAVDTACSSSLSAVHLACESIRQGENRLAIAGGVNLFVTPWAHILTSQVGMQAVDGRCRTFDEAACGTVFSEGCGVVLLKALDKALEDGDAIWGVIKGSGLNQDGKTNGITAPSALSQQRLITEVYRKYNIDPARITYVEAHGTATRLGDPIEVQALSHAFETFGVDRQSCAIGSVKTNIGHGAYSAGIAGLIKVLLCLKYKKYVPSLHFERANSHIDFTRTPFYVTTQCKDWPLAGNQTRLAAVSSFGFSGTNAHVVIAESPQKETRSAHHAALQQTDAPVMVPLSAKNEERLRAAARALLNFVQTRSDDRPANAKAAGHDRELPCLTDIAYTLQVGREAMEARVAFSVRDVADLTAKLDAYLNHDHPLPGCYQGHVQENRFIRELFDSEEDLAETVARWMRKQKTDKLLNLWVKGQALDWSGLYGSVPPKRISLPAYPFARERWWIPDMDGSAGSRVLKMTSPAPQVEERQVSAFEPAWREQGVNAPESAAGQRWICFLSGHDHQQAFERALQSCAPSTNLVFIAADRSYEKQTAHRYRIDTSDEATWIQAFNAIHAELGAVDTIQYLWAIEDPRRIPDLAAVITLFETLAASRLRPDRIVLAGSSDRPETHCHLEAWPGLARPPAALLPGTSVQVMMEKNSEGSGHGTMALWARRLWLESGTDTGPGVLYSGPKRYLPEMKPIDPTRMKGCPFQEHGTYLITGGCSPLGYRLSAHLAQKVSAKLILSGPAVLSADQQARIEALETAGAKVLYLKTDLNRTMPATKDLQKAQNEMGPIRGVIHLVDGSAETTLREHGDRTVPGRLAECARELSTLDSLCAGVPFDFFCFLSVGSASDDGWGACARRVSSHFRSAWAGARKASKSPGHIMVIDWLAPTAGQRPGTDPPEVDAALALFEQIVSEQRLRAVVHAPAGEFQPDSSTPPLRTSLNHSLMDGVQRELKRQVQKLLKIDQARLDVNTHLGAFGFDSINLTAFARRLSDQYGIEITPNVLFGHHTLAQLADFLIAAHGRTVRQYHATAPGNASPADEGTSACQAPVQQKPPAGSGSQWPIARPDRLGLAGKKPEPLAIIGMSCEFPKSENPEIFWENLKAGRDCIGEVPTDRWDGSARDGFPCGEGNQPRINRGGFLDGIGDFDPSFFGITSGEAETMDPQQRLLMTHAYWAIEDAGYSPKGLSGSSVGIFVGTQNSGYAGLLEKAGLGGDAYTAAGMLASMGPNRMSFFLNLHGPSEPVETACASSLVAIRRAMMAINSGDCDMAIVGGINTIVTPRGYKALARAGMLSPDGRCKPFAADADGFVRSEGAGMLVLKKLGRAEEDGDHIYGVIRSCVENHGGRANMLTAPNPVAQAELIASAYRLADVDPRTVTFIEAHGTGTALGDSIEIDALKHAFAALYRETEASACLAPDQVKAGAHCGLGSVKSNIGHTELASGVAGVIKILLQLKHKTLVKSLHCDALNPYLKFDGSPFFVVQEMRPWKRLTDRQGHPVPRRAGASAFGLGGVNTHVVIEEYRPQLERSTQTAAAPQLVVFSAANPAGLRRVAQGMLSFVQARTELAMADFAYTLQVGRDHQTCRLAMVVNDRCELIAGLQQFLDPGAAPGERPLFKGDLQLDDSQTRDLLSGPAGQGLVERLIEENNLEKMALYWVKGGEIPWRALHPGSHARRMALPTYPFEKNRFWAADVPRPRAGATVQPGGPTGSPDDGHRELFQLAPALIADDATHAGTETHLFQTWFQ